MRREPGYEVEEGIVDIVVQVRCEISMYMLRPSQFKESRMNRPYLTFEEYWRDYEIIITRGRALFCIFFRSRRVSVLRPSSGGAFLLVLVLFSAKFCTKSCVVQSHVLPVL